MLEVLVTESKSYVMVGGDVYPVDTEGEIEIARAAMVDAGIAEAPVFVGCPDGLGDSYRNGQCLMVLR